jgi:hypothetical protein
MQRDVQAVLDGALGGALGTAGMSGLMLPAGKAGLMGEHPPDKIAGAALEAVGIHEPDEEAQDAVASVLHLGFGMGCGALFGLLHCRMPFRVHGGLHGMLFATIIWAASYQGWIPALGIMPPASKDRPDRPRVMFVAHLLYGALLGIVVERRSPEKPDRRGERRDAESAEENAKR